MYGGAGIAMFYVTKTATSGIWVMDTEDGVEEKLHWKDVRECIDKGIRIEGVDYNSETGQLRTSVYEYNIDPQLAKVKFLTGVTYQTSGDTITLLRLDKEGSTIFRVSDLGSVLAEYALHVNKGHLTLVFDDKITKVTHRSFANVNYSDITCDLRELHDDKLAEIIYHAFAWRLKSRAGHNAPIVDRPERWAILEPYTLITTATATPESFSAEAEDYFLKKRKKKMLRYFKCSTYVSVDGAEKRRYLRFLDTYLKNLNSLMRGNSGVYTFLTIFLEWSSNESSAISTFNLSSVVMGRIKEYIYYFRAGGQDKDLVKSFLIFCENYYYGLKRLERG